MPKSNNSADKVKSEDLDVNEENSDTNSSFESDSVDNAVAAYRN